MSYPFHEPSVSKVSCDWFYCLHFIHCLLYWWAAEETDLSGWSAHSGGKPPLLIQHIVCLQMAVFLFFYNYYNFQQFGNFWQFYFFGQFLQFVDNFDNFDWFGQFWQFLTIVEFCLTILKCFEILTSLTILTIWKIFFFTGGVPFVVNQQWLKVLNNTDRTTSPPRLPV